MSILTTVAACAGTPPPPDGEPGLSARSELVCAMETPTGSHMPKRVCRYESDADIEDEKVRLLEDRMRDRAPISESRPGGN